MHHENIFSKLLKKFTKKDEDKKSFLFLKKLQKRDIVIDDQTYGAEAEH